MAFFTPRPIEAGGLGRRVPTDFKHVEKYPLRTLAGDFRTPLVINDVLALPWWHSTHDQGSEGACVGFGGAMMMAIANSAQRRAEGTRPYTVRYDPWWLWDRSKEIDEWPETQPGDDNGTSVRASCEIARTLGLVRLRFAARQPDYSDTSSKVALPEHGISAYRWATNVDEMRAAIANGLPVSIGVNWYSNFDRPLQRSNGEWWIGESGDLGHIRGGHCVCVYGASDKRQAFRIKNSWGKGYPLVWLPYSTMARLLVEYGEAAIITDR